MKLEKISLTVLQQLSGQALSAADDLVISLKEQIQKGLTATATESAAGGLLKQ